MKRRWLTYASRGVVALALFAVVAAPLQGIVPVAHAQVASSTSNSSGADQTSCWSSSWGTCVANVVYVFTVGLMSIFAYIGSYVFNIAIQVTLSSVTYSQLFVTNGWTMVRDLANMAFIFMLVYLALTVIFNAESPNTLRLLAVIIIVALLINFSFFITRVVVDGGNILSTQFYNAIQTPTTVGNAQNSTGVVGAVQSVASVLPGTNNTKDLTGNIMNLINVQNLLGSDSFSAFASSIKGSGGVVGSVGGGFGILLTLSFVYIAVAAILAMLAFTFLFVGIKFLMRVVILWFVIISAPLAFVARAMPVKAANDLFTKWRSALVQQSLYPAVFLFLFLIINSFAGQLGASVSSISKGGLLAAGFSDAAKAASGGALLAMATAVSSIAIRLGIVVGMIYLAMKASEKVATTGVAAVDKIGSRFGKYASQTIPATFNGVGAGARRAGGIGYTQTAGRVAGNLDSRFANTRFGNSRFGAFVRRNTTGLAADVSIGGAESQRARTIRLRTEARGRSNDLRDVENRAASERAAVALAAGGANLAPEDENRVRRMSSRELEALRPEQLTQVASLLSTAQIQAIGRSTTLTDAQREQITAAWEARGTRTNPLGGPFGANDAPLNRADRNIREIRDLIGMQGNAALAALINVAPGQHITGGTLTTALTNIENEIDRIETARGAATEQRLALNTQRAREQAELAAATAAGNLAAVAASTAAITRLTTDIGTQQAAIVNHVTELRNMNRLSRHVTDLNTSRRDVGAHTSHITGAPIAAGEFDTV